MQQSTLYKAARITGYVIILLGGASICYASGIAIMYWTGIGV